MGHLTVGRTGFLNTEPALQQLHRAVICAKDERHISTEENLRRSSARRRLLD
jgi:hypothetical protein